MSETNLNCDELRELLLSASAMVQRYRAALEKYAKGKWYPVKIEETGITRWTLDAKEPHLIAEKALGDQCGKQ